MTKTLISVIIPVYNAEKYLRKCLDSVIAQSYTNIEIICINDCSNDCSSKIVKEYDDPRIVLIENETNLGAGLTRNKGVEAAKGDWIYFLDSDDWLLPDAFKKLADNIEKFPNAEIISYLYYDYDNKTKKISLNQHVPKEYSDKLLNANDCPKCIKYFGYGMSKLISRAFLIKNKIEYKNETCSEDVPHFFDLVKNAKYILFLNEKIFCYRRLTNSRSCNRYSFIEYYKNFVNLIDEKFKESNDELKTILYAPIWEEMVIILIHQYVYFKIPFSEFKEILSNCFYEKYFDYDAYYPTVYKKMINENKNSLYFRFLLTFKYFFPTYFNFLVRIKKIF